MIPSREEPGPRGVKKAVQKIAQDEIQRAKVRDVEEEAYQPYLGVDAPPYRAEASPGISGTPAREDHSHLNAIKLTGTVPLRFEDSVTLILSGYTAVNATWGQEILATMVTEDMAGLHIHRVEAIWTADARPSQLPANQRGFFYETINEHVGNSWDRQFLVVESDGITEPAESGFSAVKQLQGPIYSPYDPQRIQAEAGSRCFTRELGGSYGDLNGAGRLNPGNLLYAYTGIVDMTKFVNARPSGAILTPLMRVHCTITLAPPHD